MPKDDIRDDNQSEFVILEKADAQGAHNQVT